MPKENYKYSIITATYNRPRELSLAVDSVINQNYNDWEIIVVNDSPNSDYSIFENNTEYQKYFENGKIKYFKNKENKGVNYTRNFALDNVSIDTDYIIILDDDDWFAENIFIEAKRIINNNPNYNWFVSNRVVYKENEKEIISLTKNKNKNNIINYTWDYLIKKKFSGDATHIINWSKYKNIRFSKNIKNAEEWFYFSQLSPTFYYYNFNSTYTEGYQNTGLTNNYKNKREKLYNTHKLFIELWKLKKINVKIFIYFVLRIGAIILK